MTRHHQHFSTICNIVRVNELRALKNGKHVLQFSIAINKSYKVGDEWKEDTVFMDCEAWEKTADYINDKAKKGMLVHICGAFKTDRWVDKQTQETRTRLRLRILEFSLLPQPERKRREPGEDDDERPARAASTKKADPDPIDFPDDCPF